jgi:cardiolipin synthase
MRILRAAPNLLTLLRLGMTPWIAWSILEHNFPLAIGIFVTVAITDSLDGWIARRYRAITRAGALLDPVADKALLSTIYICLGVSGAIPVWLVYVVFGRDLFILLLAAAALLFTPLRDFPPSVWGKVSTFVQVVCAVTVMVWKTGWLGDLAALARLMFGIVAAAAFWSALHYLVTGLQRLRAHGWGNQVD